MGLTVTGTLTLAGSAGNLAKLTSMYSGIGAHFKLTGSQSITYAEFKDINASWSSGLTIYANDGTCVDSGGNTNIEFDASILKWDGGGTTNNWSEAANWTRDTVPNSSNKVFFDATSSKNCTVNINPNIASLTVTSSYTGVVSFSTATITINSGDFDITAASGHFDKGTSTIKFTGSVDQSMKTFNNAEVYNLENAKTAGNLQVNPFLNAGIIVSELKCGAATVTKLPGNNGYGVTVNTALNLQGTAGNLAKLCPNASVAYLNLQGTQAIYYAEFENIDASWSSGATIYANNGSCVDSGGNTNIVFAPYMQKFSPPGTNTNLNYGYSVAIDGNYAVVGCPVITATGGYGGYADVYYYDGTSWTKQAQLTPNDVFSGSSNFGSSVAISGDYIIVGSAYHIHPGLAPGGAHIFVRSGATWTQQAKLYFDVDDNTDVGYAVAIYGTTAVVSARSAPYEMPYVKIFERDGTTWSSAQMIASAWGIFFGDSLAIDGDYLAIGAPGEWWVSDGRVCIYKKGTSNWELQQTLNDPGSSTNQLFGRKVSLSGNTLVIGAEGDETNLSGAAIIFTRADTTWSHQETLLPPATVGFSDNFGYSGVSISGDTLLVGAKGRDSTLGAAYIYSRSDTDWSLDHSFSSTAVSPQAYFGTAVALDSSGRVVIGATQDWLTGVWGFGAVYFFKPPYSE
jgi:hypothetical protein